MLQKFRLGKQPHKENVSDDHPLKDGETGTHLINIAHTTTIALFVSWNFYVFIPVLLNLPSPNHFLAASAMKFYGNSATSSGMITSSMNE